MSTAVIFAFILSFIIPNEPDYPRAIYMTFPSLKICQEVFEHHSKQLPANGFKIIESHPCIQINGEKA